MISYSTLTSTLASNVVELKFHRRRPKQGIDPFRRMLCTLDYTLLNSDKGTSILNFKPAINSTAYNTQDKGLVVVWDILKQDWRMVNTESCHIISTVPTTPPDKFWEYFNNTVSSMSAGQKAAFIST